MRYGEIARQIREEIKSMERSTAKLKELADELERIENATPKVESTVELTQGKLLSISETAEVLGISRPLVQQLTHRDDFPSIRIHASASG